jgi:hypothetical protein
MAGIPQSLGVVIQKTGEARESINLASVATRSPDDPGG